MLVQWRVDVSWCSFPIEWEERMSEWNPLTICQHIFFRICQFQFTFTLARSTNRRRPWWHSAPIRRSTSLSLSLLLRAAAARGEEKRMMLFNWQSLSETWECVFRSPITSTHARKYCPEHARSDELMCDSFVHRSTIGWSWFDISNCRQHEWNEQKTRWRNALVSEHGCCHARQVSFSDRICTDVKVYRAVNQILIKHSFEHSGKAMTSSSLYSSRCLWHMPLKNRNTNGDEQRTLLSNTNEECCLIND